MKQMVTFPRATLALLLLLLFNSPQAAFSQTPDVLDVEAVVCRDVVDRQPVEANTSFPSTVGKLYCFSKILGAKTPTRVSHVWYYANAEKFRVSLQINSAAWRTYSMKNIQPHETGAWHVEILDAAENKLEVINFQIVNP
ncbi:MAG: DUF2914 domain-containing protein [Thermodesulfobacteriota bacterium]